MTKTFAQREDEAHPEYTAGIRGKILHDIATKIEQAIVQGEQITLNVDEATEVLEHLRFYHYSANDVGLLRALLKGARDAIGDIKKIMQELVEHTMECERELDEFHGMGKDAGAGSSEIVCRANKVLRIP